LAKHPKAVDSRARTTRFVIVAVIWVCGLLAGFYGLLGAAARYGCNANDDGFACRRSGSVVGVLITVAVVAIVAAVTLMTHGRSTRQLIAVGGFGLLALAFCFGAARILLATG
jgi:hypothetical protein